MKRSILIFTTIMSCMLLLAFSSTETTPTYKYVIKNNESSIFINETIHFKEYYYDKPGMYVEFHETWQEDLAQEMNGENNKFNEVILKY